MHARERGTLSHTAETIRVAYKTDLGCMMQGTVEDLLDSSHLDGSRGKVNLILTSPPFPLTTKKRYGNRNGEEYLKWMSELAPRLASLLAPDGSIVLEIGNAWLPGRPVMSTLPLETLLEFLRSSGLQLCQQFVCHNSARLPGPAQWVNVERIRVKDSYTHVWWMARTDRPKADNRNVLKEYGSEMRRLLKTRRYNSGRRPSGHVIQKETFFQNNGGAIPPNVLTFSNTASFSNYLTFCRERKLKLHPARMPIGLPEFFIKFLTAEGQLVMDPFAGSNTTGAAAEGLKRRWISVEANEDYAEGSKGRFSQFSEKAKPDSRGKKR